MACCPAASSHYLNQCWIIIREAFRHSPRHPSYMVLFNEFENSTFQNNGRIFHPPVSVTTDDVWTSLWGNYLLNLQRPAQNIFLCFNHILLQKSFTYSLKFRLNGFILHIHWHFLNKSLMMGSSVASQLLFWQSFGVSLSPRSRHHIVAIITKKSAKTFAAHIH